MVAAPNRCINRAWPCRVLISQLGFPARFPPEGIYVQKNCSPIVPPLPLSWQGINVVYLLSMGLVGVLTLSTPNPLNCTSEIAGETAGDVGHVKPGLINPVYGCLIGKVPLKYQIMTIGGIPP